MTRTLPPIDAGPRVVRARAALADAGVDALLLTNLVNVRWLTGFTGSAGLAVLGPDQLLLVTDARYQLAAPVEVEAAGSGADIAITSHEQGERVADALAGVEQVGLEADHVSWAQYRRIEGDWLPDATLTPTEAVIDKLRSRKDDAEVARIERAADITDAALAEVSGRLADGVTEQQFGFELDSAIRRLGASGNAFDTIVASGPNSARPHHRPSDRTIEPGDLVVVDVGALVDGYRSDMTRTFSVGEPSAEAQRIYDVVIDAQQAGVEAVADAVPTAEVDAAARAVIAEAGWADAFNHGCGHGVGLDIHELPRIGARATDVVEVGQVITVEPGVYLPGIGGVRIEDTVVVTAEGARRLTKAPKALVVPRS